MLRRRKTVPAVITKILTNTIESGSSEESTAAFQIMSALLGRRPALDPRTAPDTVPEMSTSTTRTNLALSSWDVSDESPNRTSIDWLPSSADFLEVQFAITQLANQCYS